MILIVDDDSAIRATLSLVLARAGYTPAQAESPELAVEFVRRQRPSLIIMDMNYSGAATSGEEGLELLRKLKILVPDVPVILISAWGSIPLAVEGMRLGAIDFITKPWNNRMLLQRIATALSISGNADPSRQENAKEFDRAGIIGKTPAMENILSIVRRIAPTDAPVLILGENGTGKELIAEAIHRNSRRAAHDMGKVSLGG
ncbi:MAG: response regulator, partial [Muribaculaceae bacterium]|nr:response regulator [Muribaculaceae bacterium]